MSAKARQYEAELSKIVLSHGARIVQRGKDGAGHNTITVGLNEHTRLFHFPSTSAGGRNLLNSKARLKRILREIPAPVERGAVPVERIAVPLAAAAPADQTPSLITPKSEPSPLATPQSKRLTAERRKEIAKRYLALPSLDDLMKEFDLPRARAENLLMSQRGQAADKLKVEKQRQRQELRRLISSPKVAVVAKPVPAPIPVEPIEAKPARLSLIRQTRVIRKMLTRERKSVKEVAAALGIRKTRVRLAAR